MTKITFKPKRGWANTHEVFSDGKLVGEFRFIRDRVITTPYGAGGGRVCDIATAGELSDFTTDTRHDLANFAWFKDIKRFVTAHFSTNGCRLPILAHGIKA